MTPSFNVGLSDNLTLFPWQNNAQVAIRGGILAVNCSVVSISGFSLINSVVILIGVFLNCVIVPMIGTLDAFSGVIMKINGVLTAKVVLLWGIGCAVLLASAKDANAYPVSLPPSINLAIGDQHELGLVQGNIPNGNGVRRNYVNHLVGMALGTHDVAFGNDFFRSNNSFSPLPQAVLAGLVNGTGTTINLGSGLYTYLFANYSGQQRDGVGSNFAEVWYVGNLTGVITIPGAGLSEWMLFGPGVPGVPDGGTTVMLLGAALGALGMVRRFLIG